MLEIVVNAQREHVVCKRSLLWQQINHTVITVELGLLGAEVSVLIQLMVATLSEIVILGNSWMLNLMELLLKALQRKNNKNRSYGRFYV